MEDCRRASVPSKPDIDLEFNLEIDRRHKLSFDEFEAEYRSKKRPVVLTGLMDRWPAMTKWTPRYFREEMGGKIIMRKGEALNIGDLFASFDSSQPGVDQRYVNSIMLRQQFSEIEPDIQPEIEHLLPNRLRSRWMLGVSDLVDPGGSPELLFAGPNAPFTLHFDENFMMGFITQVYGVKDLILFPPSESPYLYQSEDAKTRNMSLIGDVFNPDYEQFPLLRQAKAALVTLGPGEILFNPAGWWHASKPREISIAMLTSTVGPENWQDFCADCMELYARNNVKTLLKRAYVRLGGAVMQLEELLQKRRLRRSGGTP